MNTAAPPSETAKNDCVERLQRSVRRLSIILGATLLIALAALWQTMRPRMSKREYLLVDEAGMPRAVLGTHQDNTFLSFFDPRGHARVAISSDDEKTVLRLSSAASSMHAGLLIRKEGTSLSLLDADDSGIHLHADQRDSRINFHDSSGWPRLSLAIDDGLPFIGFMETNLAPRIVIGSGDDGGRCSFFDGNGRRRLSLGVYRDRPFLNPVSNTEDDNRE